MNHSRRIICQLQGKVCARSTGFCAPHILCTFHEYFFHFWGVLNLDIVFVRNAKMISDLCYL